ELLHEQDNDNNIQTNTKKLLLETLECGTTNYRTEKIQNKLIQESFSKEITKKSIIFLQQSSIVALMEETKDIQETSNQVKIEFTTSLPSANQTNKCKTQDSEKKDENKYARYFGSIWAPANSRELLIRKSQNDLDYYFILWDISLNVYSNKIKRCLNFYSKAEIIKTQNIGKFRAMFIKIKANNLARLLALQKAWSIHFEERKLLRITPGEFDKAILNKEEK
ncbi:31903_t:CDS:2, partial [Gigaspora margarita]